jgi:hypothetical protein
MAANRTGEAMRCDVCKLDKKLYLYTKDTLIYGLCLLCLKTQEQIDIARDYKELKEQLYNNMLKDDLQ